MSDHPEEIIIEGALITANFQFQWNNFSRAEKEDFIRMMRSYHTPSEALMKMADRLERLIDKKEVQFHFTQNEP